MTGGQKGFTRRLAAFVAQTDSGSIPKDAYDHAKVAFLDWLGVTLAGKDDPLVGKLVELARLVGGQPQATLVGLGMKTDVAHAALVNGSASHALDYDDTLVSFLGHPSVTLFPALLALSEWKGSGGRDFLASYIIGLQAGGTVGACASLDHYLAGWHATSTLGHIASAAACAKLLGLDEERTCWAIGIGATQSCGLKRVFGTMCKPFHAGRASQAGLTAALLAGMGFTCADDTIEGPQGFFDALKGKVNEEIVGMLGLGWDVVNLSQKYHASCHATHSPMEAALEAVGTNSIDIDDIESITVHSSELALQAAAKQDPETGLEGKFSISYCVANALLRGETGMQAFSDEKVRDGHVRQLMKRIQVIHDPQIKALESIVEVRTKDGKVKTAFSDILQQIPPLETKRTRVRSKFLDLAVPAVGRDRAETILERSEHLEDESMTTFAQGLA
ncbi:MAG TPA: MmgE/PrpD family protein [Deltaproteobacteria bacterium]|nr:MmgE/PrpD family protein [Deltaproteobacteria bacterium]HOM28485.1 MmgE/PrpD family protein [Deltaproteobacteria bacterium]HPP80644.1 MmgE/PrpD family protein [Deltaproteobacteria bacterium]